MTAVAAPAPPASGPRPVPWTKLVWVTWRQHRVALTGPAAAADDVAEKLAVVYVRRAGSVAHLLVRNKTAAVPAPSGWEAHPVGLEELVLAYLREPGAAALPGPRPRATQDSGIPA